MKRTYRVELTDEQAAQYVAQWRHYPTSPEVVTTYAEAALGLRDAIISQRPPPPEPLKVGDKVRLANGGRPPVLVVAMTVDKQSSERWLWLNESNQYGQLSMFTGLARDYVTESGAEIVWPES